MEQRQKFLSLFPRRDAFIWKTYEQKRWQKATGPLLDAQILGVVSDEGRGLFRGCYWAHKTRHAVLDLDISSKYHNAAELQKLQAHVAAVGLYAIPYRSSDSGGWHLYLPFDEWVESDEVNQTLKIWLKNLGYEIASGQLEIFPSGNASVRVCALQGKFDQKRTAGISRLRNTGRKIVKTLAEINVRKSFRDHACVCDALSASGGKP